MNAPNSSSTAADDGDESTPCFGMPVDEVVEAGAAAADDSSDEGVGEADADSMEEETETIGE